MSIYDLIERLSDEAQAILIDKVGELLQADTPLNDDDYEIMNKINIEVVDTSRII